MPPLRTLSSRVENPKLKTHKKTYKPDKTNVQEVVIGRGKIGLLIIGAAMSLVAVFLIYGNPLRTSPTQQWHSIDSPEGQAIHQQMMQMQQMQQKISNSPAFKK